MTESLRPGEVGQCRALARAFVFRFFENEITAGSSDLRSSFFWLLSVLVPPGLFLPVMALMKWSLANFVYGAEGVRRVAWFDKTMYLGFSMIAAGVVAAIVWNSLLVDRRDTIVLGVQPLRGRTIVVAKILALAVYIGIFVAGMHTLAACAYGAFLGNFGDFPFMFRGIAAHFIAASLASGFVLVGVCALQGVLLASLGPRIFARISPIVQLLLAVLVFESLLVLPTVGGSAIRSLEADGVAPLVVRQHGRTLTVHPERGPDAVAHAWVPNTPPIWFLGVYETVLGTPEPRLRELARTGWLSVAAVIGLVLITYPLAYRRMSIAAVESVDAGAGRRALFSRHLPALIARDPTTRAAMQFFLATLARVERHRFAVAMAAGVALALVVPVAVSSVSLLDEPLGWPTVRLLAIPFYVMACLTIGLRFAALLPGDLRASWVFDVLAPDPWLARSGTWRVTFLFAVVPITLAFLPVAWRAWGGWFAVCNLLTGLALGTLLIEVMLWRVVAMPGAQPWRPRPGHLRTWWPVYVLGFLFFTGVSPAVALLAVRQPLSLAVELGVIVLATLVLRFARRSTVIVEENEDDAPKLEVLSLN
ncbi:MAG TPA: hypothetical protein VJN96_13120 [Vicinamibacterales bacterium]|nr:hypothetical protein [Vicinamibacterales bacterium]